MNDTKHIGAVTLEDFPGWKEGLWLERVGSAVLTFVTLGLLVFLHYNIGEGGSLFGYPLWVYLLAAMLVFLLNYPYKRVSPISYDTENIYYIHKNRLVAEPWSNVMPISGDEHTNRRMMKVRFREKSLIGRHFKAVYFTPKKKMIHPEDVAAILELARSGGSRPARL